MSAPSAHEWIFLVRDQDIGIIKWCANCGTADTGKVFLVSMNHPKLPGAKLYKTPLCIGEEEQDDNRGNQPSNSTT